MVYLAHDVKHGRDVAIKVLDPRLAVALGAERFLREIEFEAALHHPNILALYDSGQAGQFLYSVMPFAEGGSLRDRLLAERQLSLDEALRIIAQVGDALAHAHAEGIVHRDIKPGNILFSSGHALVTDFGIAQAMATVDTDRLTESGITVGTPAYMSPEQAGGEYETEARSDVYSLACVLFEMLVGEPPFTGTTPQAILARQIAERPPSLEVVRPDLPSHVGAVLSRALAKVPADRPPTMAAFVDALHDPSMATAFPQARRRSKVPLMVTVAGIAAAAGAGWLLTRGPPVELSENKVAVFPLSARGTDGSTRVDGPGVAYLIEAALSHAEPLRLIDVTNRITERQLADPQLITGEQAVELASTSGAGYFLRGVVQGHQDSITVILRLFSTAGDSLVRQRSASGRVGEVALHQLGLDALKALLPALIDPARDVDLSPLRDRRADAIALWMLGERDYRHSKFESALDLYSRAIAADSSLALAAVKGAQAASWTHDRARGRALVTLAMDRDSLLPDRYRHLARGLDGYFTGQADSAAYWLERALDVDPDWFEPAIALAEVYYHALPSTPARFDSLASVYFARGLAGDQAFTPPLFHLIEGHLRAGRLDEADTLLGRFRSADPDQRLLSQLVLMRECVSDPVRMDWDDKLKASRVGPFEVEGASALALLAAKSLSAGGQQLACSEAAFRAVLRSENAGGGEKWGAFLGLQGTLIATGRNEEAHALIDSVAAIYGSARSLYVLGALAGAPMADAAYALDAFAQEQFGTDYQNVNTSESLWVLATWHQHIGDRERFGRVLRSIAPRETDPASTRADRRYVDAIQARAAYWDDPTGPLDRFRDLAPSGPDNLAWSFGEHLAPDRMLHANALFERGEYEQSEIVASAFDHPAPIMFLQFLPASLAIRHKAAVALGDVRSAETYRTRLGGLGRLELLDNP